LVNASNRQQRLFLPFGPIPLFDVTKRLALGIDNSMDSGLKTACLASTRALVFLSNAKHHSFRALSGALVAANHVFNG